MINYIACKACISVPRCATINLLADGGGASTWNQLTIWKVHYNACFVKMIYHGPRSAWVWIAGLEPYVPTKTSHSAFFK